MSKLYVKGVPDRGPAQAVTLTRSAAVGVLPFVKPFKLARIALAAGDVNSFTFNWQNPESVAIMIIQCAVNITADGGAGATLDVGVITATGTHSDTLIDGVALQPVAPHWYNSFTDQAVSSLTCGYLDANGGATDWVTGQLLLGANSDNLAGFCYLFYMLLA